MLVSNHGDMPKDAIASLRLPADLKREVESVSKSEHRPVSSTLELLVRRGLNRYKEDGVLVETAHSKRQMNTESSPTASGTDVEILATRVASLVVEQLSGRTRPPNRRPKKSPGKAA